MLKKRPSLDAWKRREYSRRIDAKAALQVGGQRPGRGWGRCCMHGAGNMDAKVQYSGIDEDGVQARTAANSPRGLQSIQSIQSNPYHTANLSGLNVRQALLFLVQRVCMRAARPQQPRRRLPDDWALPIT
jgi:hypothetical protein